MEAPERIGTRNDQKQNGPRLNLRGPPGGLFGIDQEVVTLRGPFGKLRVPTRLAAGGSTLNHPESCDGSLSERSQSQPPHLVFFYHYNQNLSSHQLLSRGHP